MPVAALELLTPEGWLLALLALLPLGGLLLAGRREEAARALLQLPAPPRRSRARACAAAVCVPLLLAAAASQPVLRSQHARTVRADAAVLVVLDTSRSMRASATPGGTTRFDRAVAAATTLREALPGVRVGLASLTDRVLPHLFPSADEEAFLRTLRNAVGIEAPPPGTSNVRATDLGQLASLGTQSYFEQRYPRRVAVVITDAETRPVDVTKLRSALAAARVQLVLVRDGSAGDRVYGEDGTIEPGYRPDPGSGATLSGLAAELGAPVIETPDGAAAARAVTAALGTGPTEQAGLQEDAFRLAPWLALATLLPLLALWHSRRA